MNQYTDSPLLSQQEIVNSVSDRYDLQPHEFIQTLFSHPSLNTGYLELTYIAPPSVRQFPRTVVNWAHIPLPEIPPDMPHVHAMNKRGYSCYFGCAVRNRMYEPEQAINEKTGEIYTQYRRGKALDAMCLTVLWVDVDCPGDEGRRQLLNGIAAPPSVLLTSGGGGWHGYWLLTEPLFTDSHEARENAVRTLKGMAIACGGDTAVADLARIMRIPGTINTKPNRGGLCEVYDFIPCYYNYYELETAFAPLAAPPPPKVQRYIPETAYERVPDWVKRYLETGRVEGNRNKTLFQAACDCFNNGMSLNEVDSLLRGRAESDGLRDHEVTATINSAYRHPRGDAKLPRHMAQRMAAADNRLRNMGGR